MARRLLLALLVLAAGMGLYPASADDIIHYVEMLSDSTYAFSVDGDSADVVTVDAQGVGYQPAYDDPSEATTVYSWYWTGSAPGNFGDVTPPPTPTFSSFTDVNEDSTVVYVNAVDDETSDGPSNPVRYQLWNVTRDDFSAWQLDHDAATVAFAQDSLLANYQYHYRVRSRDAAIPPNVSAWSPVNLDYSAYTAPDSVIVTARTTTSLTMEAVGVFPRLSEAGSGIRFTIIGDLGDRPYQQDSVLVATGYTQLTGGEIAFTPNEDIAIGTIYARNGDEAVVSTSVSKTRYTAAAIPGAPIVTDIGETSIDLTVDVNGNPAYTEFSVYVVDSSKYVQSDGALGTSAYRSTTTDVTVTGLAENVEYNITTKAWNGDVVGTDWSDTTAVTTLPAGGRTQFYVAADGGDTNPGTFGSPLKTIKTALAGLADGDTLTMLGDNGSFTTLNQGGDANMKGWQFGDSHVLLRGYPGQARPVIDYTGTSLSGSDRLLNHYNGKDGCTIRYASVANYDNTTPLIYNSTGDSLTLADVVFDSISCGASQPIINIRSGIYGVSIIDCVFSGRTNEDDFAVSFQGDGATRLEGHRVIGCAFNSQSDLPDTLGMPPAVKAIEVDSLIVRDCVMWNAGEDQGSSGNGSDAIDLRDADRVKIANIRFTRRYRGISQTHTMHNTDFLATTAWSGEDCDTVRVDSCYVRGAGHAFQLAFVNDISVSYCATDSTSDDGYFFDDTCDGATLSYSVSHWASDNTLDIQADNVAVDHCTFVRPFNDAVQIAATANTVSITNSVMIDVRAGSANMVTVTSGAASVSLDYNLYYDPDNAVSFDDEGTSRTFTTWQGQGYDTNGIGDQRPRFVRYNGSATDILPRAFVLWPSSPAWNAASDGLHIGALQRNPPPRAVGGWRSRSRDRQR